MKSLHEQYEDVVVENMRLITQLATLADSKLELVKESLELKLINAELELKIAKYELELSRKKV